MKDWDCPLGKTHRVIRFAFTIALLLVAIPLQAKTEETEVLCSHVLSRVKGMWVLSRCLHRANNHTGSSSTPSSSSLSSGCTFISTAWEHHQGSLHCCCAEATRPVLSRVSFKSLFFPFFFFITGEEEWDITLRRGFTSDVLRNIKSYQNTYYELFSFSCKIFFVSLF